MNFADTLIERIRALGHPLCVGLDPHLDRIPEAFRRGSMHPQDPQTSSAVSAFLDEVVDRLEKRVAVVKPQIALFEQLGWRGLQALDALVARCRSRGLLVVLDAKRGDVDSTAEGYARAYLDPDAPLGVDALTVNPYLGADSLAPYLARCGRHGRGVFVVVRTSNPGASDLQDRSLGSVALFEAVAQMLSEACRQLVGPKTGWSSLGAVVGAGQTRAAARVREVLPEALLLVPGFGAQGGDARQAVAGFREGPNGREGGVVNSARAILYPEARSWEIGFEDALEAAIDALRDAIS